MTEKQWIQTFFGLLFVGLASVAGVILWVDPLWTWSLPTSTLTLGFNERQQKTNSLYFRGASQYDTLLLGSSRTTYIDPNAFHDMSVFNYAVSSMYPEEYGGYIQFATQQKGSPFKTIILGLDFFGTKCNTDPTIQPPSFYVQTAQKPFYRYSLLFSFDALKQAIKSLRADKRTNGTLYTKDEVKQRPILSDQQRQDAFLAGLNRHLDNFSEKKYVPNPNYKEILEALKRENPGAQFIVFTSPITAELLANVVIHLNRGEAYQTWIKTLVDVFNEIYLFTTINSVTTNLTNYPDDDHLYPDKANWIAQKLSGAPDPQYPKDFGIRVTAENVDRVLSAVMKEIQAYPIQYGPAASVSRP